MKRAIVSILFMALTSLVLAQNSPVDKLFEKYSGKEGYTSVYISEYMFTLFSSMQTEDKEFDEAISGLSSIKILATENPKIGVNFYDEIMRELSKKDYKELMVVKEKDEHLTFLVKDVQGKIVELLLVGGGNDNVLISIQGKNIDLKHIAKISQSMQIDGLDALEKMEE
ncbi:MAG TPA: DUF4252 domain-containing protein [Tenuifilaceae bacterium]|nr:DUF4252 domain-containing protein [Tenuifilaceae bacterium]